MTEDLQIKIPEIVKLMNRAKVAYVVCDECGNAFGALPKTSTRVTLSTYYPGTCDICEKETTVTEFRDFGYLRKA